MQLHNETISVSKTSSEVPLMVPISQKGTTVKIHMKLLETLSSQINVEQKE